MVLLLLLCASGIAWRAESTASPIVDPTSKAEVDLRENTIWRCAGQQQIMNARAVAAPNVSVGIYILNLGQESSAGVGIGSGVFFADFLLFLRQRDRPLMSQGSFAWRSDDPMEQLSFSNAKSIMKVSTFGSGTWRVSGTFFFRPDLRWFPFDQQILEIALEQLEEPVWRWRFVPDFNLNGLSPSVNFPGWQSSLRMSGSGTSAQCEARVGSKVYPGASRDDMDSTSNATFSSFKYSLRVQRPIFQSFLTHFLPPAIMLAPTQYSFFLDPLTVDAMTPLSLCSGALVSLVLFHSGIARTLPPMDYLTAFDKYILCIYVCDFAALCFSIAVIVFLRADREAAKEREKLRDRVLARAEAALGENDAGEARKGAVRGAEALQGEDYLFDSRLRSELLVVSLQTGVSLFVTIFFVVLPLWIAVHGFSMVFAMSVVAVAITLVLRLRWRRARANAASLVRTARGGGEGGAKADQELALLDHADRGAPSQV